MKVALGVSGGIAAYKAAEIVRLLQDRGIRVQVIMTRAAQEFVRPLTFAALSGEKVITDLSRREMSSPTLTPRLSISRLRSRSMLCWLFPLPRMFSPICPGHRKRLPYHALPGHHRARGCRSRDECEHVESSRNAGESGDPA